MTNNQDDPQPIPKPIPPAERSKSDADDLQMPSEPPPVRMTGFDRGRMTQTAVELMLRNVID